MEHHEVEQWQRPECGEACRQYDHQPERQWRHLDTCQYRTVLHARPLRSECPQHGLRVVQLPWEIFMAFRRRYDSELATISRVSLRKPADALRTYCTFRRSGEGRIPLGSQTAGYTPVLAQQGGRSTGDLVTLFHSATWSLGPVKFSPLRHHGSALRVWEGDGISRKGALTTVLTNNRNMTSVVVVNTHLQAQYGKSTCAVVRRDQVAEPESFVAPLTGRGHLMLLAGDFNSTPSDVLYAVLLERWTDLTAGFRQVCETERRTGCVTCFDGKTSQKWIDYVFVKRPVPRSVTAQVELIRSKKRDDPHSDHEGVQVSISSESRLSWLCTLRRLEALSCPLQVT